MLAAETISEFLKIGAGLVVIVIVVIVKVLSDRTKSQPAAFDKRALPMNRATPVRKQLHVQPAPPSLPIEGDSAIAEDVAKQLAPDFVNIAHSRSLVQPETIEDAESSTLVNLREPGEARRAILLNEILRKPLGLRRPRR